MSRYARQISLPEIGAAGQARLGRARVLVAGAGGLGATVLPALCGAGVGAITLYDPDCVEQSNLHRQTLFRHCDLGQPKAQVAAQTLAGLNPDCAITPVIARLDPLNAAQAIAGVDVVLDCADNYALSYALSDLCHDRRVPLISASVLGRRGYVGGFCGGAPSLRAVFPDLPDQQASCASHGVMGPVVAALGALQAQMALSVLLDHRPRPLGQLLSLDCATWQPSGFRFDSAPEPAQRLPVVLAPQEITPADLVIDLQTAAGPDAQTPSPVPGQRVVFRCRSGFRAWHAAARLVAGGHPEVAIIADGPRG